MSESGGRARPYASWLLAVAMTGLSLIGFLLGRLRTIEAKARSERIAMEAATEALRRRNSQLTSLFNVFSEITETLTLKHVVETTLRETQKLMTADMVVLRRLESDQLVVVGAMADGGLEILGLHPVPLNSEGATSQVARNGRSLLIDKGGEITMGSGASISDPGSPSSQTGREPLESGVITPLLVGARVLGTMSCWSRNQSHFTVDDQRLMGMIASSVATAIVASEAVATSDHHAHVDPLTELPNRRQLDQDLSGVLAGLNARSNRAVIAMVDIDHFKLFNDDFGHKIGDTTLQAVASVLINGKREADYIYRFGGDEFLIIFPDTDSDEGWTLAESLRTAVEGTSLDVEGGRHLGPVTISLGLAYMPLHGSHIKGLIEQADIAMYASKATGRNRVTVWQPTSDEERAA